jgi:hypothetical protein
MFLVTTLTPQGCATINFKRHGLDTDETENLTPNQTQLMKTLDKTDKKEDDKTSCSSNLPRSTNGPVWCVRNNTDDSSDYELIPIPLAPDIHKNLAVYSVLEVVFCSCYHFAGGED